MDYEVQSTVEPVYGVTGLLSDAISKKYNSIDDMNSIKINAEDENYEDIIPVIDSIIEDENNHIGKLQQLIDMMSDSEEAIEEGKAETIEIIDNPEIMESMTTMSKKLKLNENFDNVIDDIQACQDAVFVGANKEHDENKKRYEDAMEENDKAAEETIPKEEETGKKVTSKALKAMHLSEELFEELNPEFVQDCADNICEYIMTEFNLDNSEIRKVLKYVVKHFSGPDFNEDGSFDESLNESCDGWIAFYQGKKLEIPKSEASSIYDAKQKAMKELKVPKSKTGLFHIHPAYNESFSEEIRRYSDVVPYEDRKYWYFTTHGVQPGSIPKDLNVLDIQEGRNDKGTLGTYVCLDGVLSTSELKEYDMIEKAPNMNESLQVKIAKEQLQRFAEGKMPSNWGVNTYLQKLTEKNHITKSEAASLQEWYDSKNANKN